MWDGASITDRCLNMARKMSAKAHLKPLFEQNKEKVDKIETISTKEIDAI